MPKSLFEDIGIPQVIRSGKYYIVRRSDDSANVFRNQFVGAKTHVYEWVYNSHDAVRFTTRKAAEVALAACVLSS